MRSVYCWFCVSDTTLALHKTIFIRSAILRHPSIFTAITDYLPYVYKQLVSVLILSCILHPQLHLEKCGNLSLGFP